jgi:hypothetical protein
MEKYTEYVLCAERHEEQVNVRFSTVFGRDADLLDE